MSAARCEICGKETVSFFRANHKDRGRIRICGNCLDREGQNLLAPKGCCCS